jgi:uncharacterized membrane protein
MPVLTTIARGDASRVSEPRRVVARTDEEWRALWAAHAGPDGEAPALDMGWVTVAAVFAGEKPTAGYGVEISAAEYGAADHAEYTGQGRSVTLVVEEHHAAPGGILAQVITSPFHIVSVPKGLDVTWAAPEVGGRALEVGGRASEAGKTSAIFSDVRRPTPDLRPSTTDLRSPTSDVRPPTSDLPSSTGLEPRTASALAYLAGPFSGALILLAESTNQHVRFHAWQSIVGLGGLGLAILGSYVLAFVALFVSATAVSLMVGVATVIWIVLALVWVICLFKAWSGERWKLPIVGDYAERLL